MDDINSIIYAIHPSDTLDELKENQNNNYIRADKFSMARTYYVDTIAFDKYCRRFKRFRSNANTFIKKS